MKKFIICLLRSCQIHQNLKHHHSIENIKLLLQNPYFWIIPFKGSYVKTSKLI